MDAPLSPPRSGFERFNDWRRNSLALKLFTLAILALLLLIPLGMIESLISERKYRKEEAEAEVGATWGGRQEVSGPMLTIPYIGYLYVDGGTGADGTPVRHATPELRHAHFLPSELRIEAEADPMIRKRGIYEVLVYNSDIVLSGVFRAPDFSGWSDVKEIQWENAFISVGISDLRAIREQVELEWGGKSVDMESGVTGSDVLASGISAPVQVTDIDSSGVHFRLHLRLGGHSSLMMVPLGEVTEARMHSTWPSPKFTGAFLPDTVPAVSSDGFDARWKVLHLNRNYPQRFLGSGADLSGSAFGAELMVMVDQYQRNERSVKYGIMLVTLTFLMFFFTQALNRVKVHFVQYLLVGLALSLFYLLLLSFSEHIGFNWSYLVAATATSALVVLYFRAITGSARLSGILLFVLAFVFGFIFIIIQMEDYALLTGSTGLFLILAAVMYLSRRVDWYAVGRRNGQSTS